MRRRNTSNRNRVRQTRQPRNNQNQEKFMGKVKGLINSWLNKANDKSNGLLVVSIAVMITVSSVLVFIGDNVDSATKITDFFKHDSTVELQVEMEENVKLIEQLEKENKELKEQVESGRKSLETASQTIADMGNQNLELVKEIQELIGKVTES